MAKTVSEYMSGIAKRGWLKLTPEQRRERALRAIETRIAKEAQAAIDTPTDTDSATADKPEP